MKSIKWAWALGLVTGFLGASLQAWEGHDWNQWRQVTTWQKPELRTHQAGRRELAPLLAGAGNSTNPIASSAAWEQRRKETADAIQTILGKPGGLTIPPVEVRGSN